MSGNWGKPGLWQRQRLRSKATGQKSNCLSAVLDRKRRRKVLPGYPVDPFDMSRQEREDYFTGDSITCLLCGKKYRTLGGAHLQKIHGITEDEYREKYGIPYTQGLSCGDLLEIRKEQGKDKTDKLRKTCPKGRGKRKKARLNNAAVSARRENMKALRKPKKLNSKQIEEIKKSDATQRELGEKYNVSQALISAVVTGKYEGLL